MLDPECQRDLCYSAQFRQRTLAFWDIISVLSLRPKLCVP